MGQYIDAGELIDRIRQDMIDADLLTTVYGEPLGELATITKTYDCECVRCGTHFKGAISKQKYCSDKCSQITHQRLVQYKGSWVTQSEKIVAMVEEGMTLEEIMKQQGYSSLAQTSSVVTRAQSRCGKAGRR